jgi:hypothetical protein
MCLQQSLIHYHHHPPLQRLSFLAPSVLKRQAIFFLAFLDHVFLSVDNMKVTLELPFMASSVNVKVNVSSFHVFA